MAPLNNNQWERFCLAIFSGKNQTEAAIEAGYNPKWARSIASRLSTKVNIAARIKELQEAAAAAKIMTVRERKERLSEIARGRLVDYLVDSDPLVDKNSPNPGAISGYEVTTRYAKDGEPTHTRSIRLHSPIQAIAELNKMEGAYQPAEVNVHHEGEVTIKNIEVNLSGNDSNGN